MTLAAGTKIGPFEILSTLGAGGMGEVYRARDTRLGREVALKILPELFSRDADRLRRFEQEARAVAALNHPNILAIHDIGEQDGAPYLVSELLEGASLRAELENGALPPRKAADYAAQIAQGLAAAHEKNFIHRDLKPENVFILKDGRVKILDFGLAKLAATLAGGNSEAGMMTLTSLPTEAGVVLGTAGYMSPEQVRGSAVDSRTDIFAFGAVLYEMLSGQRAFRRDTAAETMTAILKEDPPELHELSPAVPPGLERIVRRCLEKKPEQRFQSAKDLAFALEALSGSASKTAASAAIDSADKSRRWLPIAGAAVLGLALGAGIAWSLRPAPTPPPTFAKMLFDRGFVIRARLSTDGETVLYSGILADGLPSTYVLRKDYPESAPSGLQNALILSISRQGQMAVVVRPKLFAHYQWYGTLATAPLGGAAPRELLENVYDADWSPDGKDLAVIAGDQKNWRLEYPIGKVLLQGNNWISDARVSPDGNQIALFQHPGNSGRAADDRGEVAVVDRSGRLRTLSTGWESLEGLAWTPSGKEVWFSAAESGEQYCIHATTLSGKQRTVYCGTSGARVQDIAASGRALVATNETQLFMPVLEHGATDAREMGWLGGSILPRISRDGSEILFTDVSEQGGNDYSVYVRKPDGSPPVRIGGGGYGTDISPDAKWAAIALPGDPKSSLQIVPVGPGQAHDLHWDGFQILWTGWFPDGKRMLLYASQSGQPTGLYSTDSNGAPPKWIAAQGIPLEGVAPDGDSLLQLQDGAWELRSIQSGAVKPLPALHSDEQPIAWAEDSNHLFIQSPSFATVQIYRLDISSGARQSWQLWKPKDAAGVLPQNILIRMSADGRWIVFNYRTQVGQLYSSDTLR